MKRKGTMILKGLTCIAVCLVGALALAGPATQPTRGGRGGGGGGGDPKGRPTRPDGPDRSPGGGMFGRDTISDADMAASDDFFKKHTPNTWASIQKLSEQGKTHTRHMLAQRYLALQAMLSNPDELGLYNNKIEQVDLEDQIFGMVQQVKDKNPATQDAKWSTGLRDKIARLVDLRMAEREERIERIQKTIAQEATQLEVDKKNTPETVERWFAKAVKGEADFLRGDRRPGPGPGRDGPRPPKPTTNLTTKPATNPD